MFSSMKTFKISQLPFRGNCDINIVQQTSCEPLFPVAQMQLKTYFFVPFVRPCLHLNYGVISGSHACRDCGWHIILVAGALYNLPWRASVSSHQVQCNIPTFEALLRKYKYLFLERCRKSNNLWLRTWMQSDCLYLSLFFQHYNRILLCDWVIELCSIRLIDGVSSHNAFAFYLD